jgi:hypothetical protein
MQRIVASKDLLVADRLGTAPEVGHEAASFADE